MSFFFISIDFLFFMFCSIDEKQYLKMDHYESLFRKQKCRKFDVKCIFEILFTSVIFLYTQFSIKRIENKKIRLDITLFIK